MSVSIQQAACNALGAKILAVLSATLPDVVVNYDWPDPEAPLPRRGITVLLAGGPDDAYLQPEVDSSVAVVVPVTIPVTPPDLINRVYRWKMLERSQPLQIDVWAIYAIDRDDMVAKLDQLFNTGWGDSPEPGLLLPLGDGWAGKAAFDFDGPSVTNSGPSNQVSEFRGTYSGQVRVVLYVDAVSPKMARVKMHQLLDGSTVDRTLLP